MNTNRDDRILEALRTYDDETAIRLLREDSIERAFRPRDEWDDDDLPPDSLRAAVLRLYDEVDRIWAELPLADEETP